MTQERYVIFTTEENQGLETILGNFPNDDLDKGRRELGNTPEAIAASMKELNITPDSDIYYASGMEFGKETGFKTNNAPIELFEDACDVYMRVYENKCVSIGRE